MSEIKESGTQVMPRYYKGYVTGLGLTLRAEYAGVQFEAEANWEIPEERRCYAEDFTRERMGEEVQIAHQETGVRMELYKKIWEWQQANES